MFRNNFSILRIENWFGMLNCVNISCSHQKDDIFFILASVHVMK